MKTNNLLTDNSPALLDAVTKVLKENYKRREIAQTLKEAWGLKDAGLLTPDTETYLAECVEKVFLGKANLEELSKKTLGGYIKKAATDIGNKEHSAGSMKGGREADPDRAYDPVIQHNHAKIKKQEKVLINKAANRQQGIGRAVQKLTKEEENLDELSKKTLGSYVKKASDDASNKSFAAGYGIASGNDESSSGKDTKQHGIRMMGKSTKRLKGIDTAVKKLTKEENLEELSARTLGSYVKKAKNSTTRMAYDAANTVSKKKTSNFDRKITNRMDSIDRATDKIVAKVGGRPSKKVQEMKMTNEEILDEISRRLVARYVSRVSGKTPSDPNKFSKRMRGLKMATKKLIAPKKTVKEEVDVKKK
jgi:hypothetical protein